MTGMTPTPCTWPVDMDCLDTETTDPGVLRRAVDAAVMVLWALTGRQLGVCESVARPCPQTTEGPRVALLGVPWMVPVLDAGVWRNLPACAGGACDHPGPSVVHLPGPVHSVTAVTVDGVEVDPDSWTVEGNRLYRSGGRPWPTQDYSRPAGEPGTWAVTYLRGTPPPAGAGRMVALLAREFILSCTNPDRCALPRRATQVQRQGVTVQMADPLETITAGGTGLPEVDLWVQAINPHRLAAPPAVWSPDVRVW